MDPQTTLKDIQSYLEIGEVDEAVNLIEDLRGWVRKGGFMPESTDILLNIVFQLQNRLI